MSENNELATTAQEQETISKKEVQKNDIDLTKYVAKAEMNELLTKVRSQEREKLHSRLEEQKAKAQELQSELQDLKKAMENKLDIPAPPPEQEPDPDKSPGDALRLMQKRMDEQGLTYKSELDLLKEELIKAKKEALAATEAAKKAYQKDKLDAYKESLVKDLKFPDRVKGNSEEEILKSYEAAKREEEAILEEIKAATHNQFRQEMAKRLPPGLQPSLPSGSNNVDRKLTAKERRKRVMDKNFIDQANDRIRKLAFGE
jgi:hypothetical protein